MMLPLLVLLSLSLLFPSDAQAQALDPRWQEVNQIPRRRYPELPFPPRLPTLMKEHLRQQRYGVSPAELFQESLIEAEECERLYHQSGGHPNAIYSQRCLNRDQKWHPTKIRPSHPRPRPDPEKIEKDFLMEKVGREILAKLGLKEAPKISNEKLEELKKLSRVFLENVDGAMSSAWKRGGGFDRDSDHDDHFYKKTRQLIIFSQPGLPECQAPCFEFHLPTDSLMWYVKSADLWLHKSPALGSSEDNFNRIVVKEIHSAKNSSKVVAEQKIHKRGRSWVPVTMGPVVETWVEDMNAPFSSPPSTKHLRIHCEDCHVSSLDPERPFLRLQIGESHLHKRPRRNLDCSSMSSDDASNCCRQELEVVFAQLNFNFIAHPHGYQAYYCRGTCTSMKERHEQHTLNAYFRQYDFEQWISLTPVVGEQPVRWMAGVVAHSACRATAEPPVVDPLRMGVSTQSKLYYDNIMTVFPTFDGMQLPYPSPYECVEKLTLTENFGHSNGNVSELLSAKAVPVTEVSFPRHASSRSGRDAMLLFSTLNSSMLTQLHKDSGSDDKELYLKTNTDFQCLGLNIVKF
ncbi:unnamed protein product [Cyprideis torosa]|uniref:Uncharacterized protein n=1 Tax=Cyprideis torosa TaxID=163714 RepID=A0A7R8WC19_9CRUS|nr:unnamed protein product [Cyprideis torosa]CAG0886940.1 unnamed protein product [Cyprideis torosa]